MSDDIIGIFKQSRPLQVGLALAIAYIVLTWGLYQSWLGSVEPSLTARRAGSHAMILTVHGALLMQPAMRRNGRSS